ncbi:hypothetical protein GGI35DRAFT_198613 [Trichoderma velutinum]
MHQICDSKEQDDVETRQLLLAAAVWMNSSEAITRIRSTNVDCVYAKLHNKSFSDGKIVKDLKDIDKEGKIKVAGEKLSVEYVGTIFHLAVLQGRYELIKELYYEGANVNSTQSLNIYSEYTELTGRNTAISITTTAMDIAARRQDEDMKDLLAKCGALEGGQMKKVLEVFHLLGNEEQEVLAWFGRQQSEERMIMIKRLENYRKRKGKIHWCRVIEEEEAKKGDKQEDKQEDKQGDEGDEEAQEEGDEEEHRRRDIENKMKREIKRDEQRKRILEAYLGKYGPN